MTQTRTSESIIAELAARGFTVEEQPLQERRWPDGYCTVGWQVMATKNGKRVVVRSGTRATAYRNLHEMVTWD